MLGFIGHKSVFNVYYNVINDTLFQGLKIMDDSMAPVVVYNGQLGMYTTMSLRNLYTAIRSQVDIVAEVDCFLITVRCLHRSPNPSAASALLGFPPRLILTSIVTTGLPH